MALHSFHRRLDRARIKPRPTSSGKSQKEPLRNHQVSAMPKINRDGVHIYYEIHGSGPALLLTHGYSLTSAMWQGQIAALSKHHTLILWDMRGHGQSDYPADPL